MTLRYGISWVVKVSLLAVTSFLFILVLHEARVELVRRENIMNEWRREKVTAPEGVPRLGQKSIDIALALYGIQIPSSAKYPTYSSKLIDRGLSMREPWDDKITVQVGPSAFTSWALLGSTLAHELEVHCRQSFIMINFLDSLGLDGTGEAERQAYLHELKHTSRFGLSHYDAQLITATMDYYYPSQLTKKTGNKVAGQVTNTLGKWLARRFVVPVY